MGSRKFYVHPINLPEDAAIVDHEQKVGMN